MMGNEKSFDIKEIHPNENINYYINISSRPQLIAPDLSKEQQFNINELERRKSASLYNGKIPLFFLEDENLKSLLINTKNDISYRPLPFMNIFIDITQEFKPGKSLIGEDEFCELTFNKDNHNLHPMPIKCILHGIFVTDLQEVDNPFGRSTLRINSPIEVVFLTVDGEEHSFYGLFDCNIGSKFSDAQLLSFIPNDSVKQIKEFICNIVDFINHPEVEFICNEHHKRNDLRLKRGKHGLPSKYHLVLKGKLKKYINDTITNNEKAWELGHRFWVRGHWMEFKHECYKNKRGQKTWILPYIKGKGELIKKDYYVGEKEQCWEHEKQMIKIVRELYPEHKVETHNRTILDGLEIDCYIPELKLGFEYNGLQHYEHVEFFHKTKEEFQAQLNRDIEKLKRAEDKGIKIITIKYDEPVTKETIEDKQ